jgi:small subunit ribosomal protein S13
MYLIETKLSEIKSVFFALTKIYGIGDNRAFLICKKLGFLKNFKLKRLSENQIYKIIKLVEVLNLSVTNDLKKFRVSIIKKATFIKSYKGFRRVKGLPVRGQRTHTNSKSAKKQLI